MTGNEGRAGSHHHAGHRERLRQRFIRAGLEGFAPHETLELLLTYAIPRRDVNPVAHRLMQHFGSLHAVLQAAPADLMAVEGIGESAAVFLSLLLPVFRAYRQSQEGEAAALSGTGKVRSYCEALLLGQRLEQFYVIALDPSLRVLASVHIAQGDEGETAVYPRQVLAALLRCGAAGAVVAHNHPQAEATPSQADRDMTRALGSLLAGVGIALHDHVIVGKGGTFSFRENGLLQLL